MLDSRFDQTARICLKPELVRRGTANIAGPLTIRLCASIVANRINSLAVCSIGGSLAKPGSRK